MIVSCNQRELKPCSILYDTYLDFATINDGKWMLTLDSVRNKPANVTLILRSCTALNFDLNPDKMALRDNTHHLCLSMWCSGNERAWRCHRITNVIFFFGRSGALLRVRQETLFLHHTQVRVNLSEYKPVTDIERYSWPSSSSINNKVKCK